MLDQPFKLERGLRYQDRYSTTVLPWTKTITNLTDGTIFGRTPIHWLLLLCFYIAFFGGIVLHWSICYWVFETTLSDDVPKYLLSQPGFIFEPSLDGSQEIEYQETSTSDVMPILCRINTALLKYGPVPKDRFGKCRNVNGYGYWDRKPCIFLKINRIIGFKTETIESVTDLPLEAPHELRVYIKDLPPDERKNRIWLSCDSKPMLDFIYYPNRYYSTDNVNWFKVRGAVNQIDDHHLFNKTDFSRIVAVQLKDVLVNVRYQVRCIIWAKNIERDFAGKMGRGLVHFKLLIKS